MSLSQVIFSLFVDCDDLSAFCIFIRCLKCSDERSFWLIAQVKVVALDLLDEIGFWTRGSVFFLSISHLELRFSSEFVRIANVERTCIVLIFTCLNSGDWSIFSSCRSLISC